MKKKGRIENYEDVTTTWIIAPPIVAYRRSNMLFQPLHSALQGRRNKWGRGDLSPPSFFIIPILHL